jgi:hypothetical protein
MRIRIAPVPVFFLLTALASPASASSVILAGLDNETNQQASLPYTLSTIGNSTIQSGLGFTPASGVTALATSLGLNYTNYLSALPFGAVLTGATLNFAGLFSTPTTTSSLTSGTLFYTPAFASSLSTYTVTITSTLANATVTGSSGTNYDLWPAFSADILAGHTINIKWSAVDTLTGDTSTYANNCKNCSETLQVTSTANFVASNTSNSLTLNFTGVAAPEPGTLSLAGFVLIGLAFARRRR